MRVSRICKEIVKFLLDADISIAGISATYKKYGSDFKVDDGDSPEMKKMKEI